MARGKHEAQQVVTKVAFNSSVKIGRAQFLDLELASQLLLLPLKVLLPAQHVDRVMFGCSHEPGTWPLRDTCLGPLLKSRHECVLRDLFGQADVADHVRDAGDDLRRLDAPYRLNRSIGGGHGRRFDVRYV
jgi:hypothetical protein